MRIAACCFAALAATALAPAQAADDAKLFEERCGKCHAVEKLAPALAKRSAAARGRYLERFLQRHYAPDGAERKRIVAWLGAQADAKR